MEELSTRLSDLLASHDITQRKLSKEADISNSTVSRILSGEMRNPTADTLVKLADYFGVSTDYLLGRES